MNKKNNNKGFTLAELLIVVAIIAVLVAIAIPVFNSQLEKSREATDAANIRNAYAENMVAILDDPTNTTPVTASVVFKQKQDGWQNDEVKNNLMALSKAGNASGDLDVEVTNTSPTNGGSAAFTITSGNASTKPKMTITIG